MMDESEKTQLAVINEKLDSNIVMTRDIQRRVVGNDVNPGIVTRLCLVEESLVRAWWFYGILFGIFGVVLGVLFKICGE
jgi:hypothetical protein